MLVRLFPFDAIRQVHPILEITTMLLEALARDDHPLYNVEWAMRLWRSCQCAVVLQKLWGLTHPERPFAASANVIVLEGQDAEQVVEICGGLGHDLTRSLQCTIPFTFPPYLCDADWELQHAHCLLARREPIGRKPNVGGGGTPEGATTFAAMRGRSSITLGICGAGLETAHRCRCRMQSEDCKRCVHSYLLGLHRIVAPYVKQS